MNMMDSVFYLGLVVTFLLILLVVYHFKNRVTTMEQRCDTMFEIMNNIVQELNLLRRQQNITLGGGVPVNITTSTNEEVYNDHSRQEDLEEELEPENRVVELENEINPEESPSPDTMQSLLLDIDDNNSIKIDKVETTLENDEVHEYDESNMDAYKSMTNSALKALVIDKGLSTNPSKLKKTELLDLLKELE